MPETERERVLSQLRCLNAVNAELIKCKSIEEIVQKALEKVRMELNAQVASIFLFNKDGMVERVGINGVDKDGKPIDNTWFSEEQYYPGKSFTGKVIPPYNKDKESSYGETQYSNDFDCQHEYSYRINEEQLNKESVDKYRDKLGKLKSAISVPLNGARHTFGVLEVLNKIEKEELAEFIANDIYILSLIAATVANVISEFRKIEHRQIYNSLIEKLIDLKDFGRGLILEDIHEFIAKKVIEESTAYKVCIIRIFYEGEGLKITGKSHTEGIRWKDREDTPIEPKNHTAIAIEVYDNQKSQFIEDIDANISKYYNQKWITNNQLKSHACLPLVVKDECVGTISVYTSYPRKFYDNDKNFLKHIAYLTAALTARVRLIKELKKVRKELQEEQDKFLNFSRALHYDSVMEGFLHNYKNELIDFNINLQKFLSDSNTSKKEKDQIIHGQMDWIKKRCEEIKSEFNSNSDNDSLTPVQINQLIKKTIENILLNDDEDIQRSENYNEIPMIEVNESKIKQVIFNLIKNAIAALKKGNNRDKKIVISTDVTTSGGIQYIEITIEDNGIGIPNENKNKVFNRGFTTRRDEGGTGMGLFVAHTIIEGYGGKIHFNSQVGKGTTFFVNIPLMRHKC